MEVRLSLSKITPPRPPLLLERRRLFKLLDSGVKKGVAYIAAPAGYGKTSLLAGYVSKKRKKVAWLTVDENDRDFFLFFQYLISSIQKVFPEFGSEITKMIRNGRSRDLSMFFNTMTNEISEIKEKFILVIDDLHCVQEEDEIQALINFMIENQIPNLSLLIASRREPQGKLSYNLTRTGAIIVTERDLRFSPEEMSNFARMIGYGKLSKSEIKTLSSESRGWAIAVVNGLNAIATGKKPFLSHISDYFEQIFDQLPEKEQEFLLLASVLPHLNKKLVHLIYSKKSAPILRSVINRGVFITALADKRNYLIHPLFRSFLLERLKNTNLHKFIKINSKIGRHFTKIGQFSLGVEYLLDGLEFDRVLAKLMKKSEDLLTHQRYSRVETWLNRIPEERLNTAQGRYLIGHIKFLKRDVDSAEVLLKRALRAFRKNKDIDGLAKTKALLLRIDLYRGFPKKALRKAKRFLKKYPTMKSKHKAEILNNLAGAYSQLHKKEESINVLKDCIKLVKRNPQLRIHYLTDLAVFTGQYGELHYARKTIEEILKKPISLYEKMVIGTPRIWVYLLLGMFNHAMKAIRELGRINTILKDETANLWKDIAQSFYYVYTGAYHKTLSYLQVQDLLARSKEESIPYSQVVEAKVRALSKLGHHHEAERIMDDVFSRLGTKYIQSSGRLLHIRAIVNRKDRYFQQALRHHKKYPYFYRLAEVHFDYGQYLLEQGSAKKTLRQLNKALDICDRFRYDFLLYRYFNERPELLDFALEEKLVSTIPRKPRTDSLQILTLGPVEVKSEGRKIDAKEWGWRKNLSLFAFFILNRNESYRKEDLLDIFWPDLESKKATQLLHNAFHRIRQVFNQEIIHYHSGRYQLVSDIHIWSDVDDYIRNMELALEDIKQRRFNLVQARVQYGQRLRRGKILADIFDEWVEDSVDDFEITRHGIIEQLVKKLVENDRGEEAKKIMRSELKLDPECRRCNKLYEELIAQ